MGQDLTEDEREEIAGGIENQGFGYWIENYGYDGNNDPELKKLCREAEQSMRKLRNYLEDNDIIY